MRCPIIIIIRRTACERPQKGQYVEERREDKDTETEGQTSQARAAM